MGEDGVIYVGPSIWTRFESTIAGLCVGRLHPRARFKTLIRNWRTSRTSQQAIWSGANNLSDLSELLVQHYMCQLDDHWTAFDLLDLD